MDARADRTWVTVGGVTVYRLYLSGNGTLAHMTRQTGGGGEVEIVQPVPVSDWKIVRETRRMDECAFEVSPDEGDALANGRVGIFDLIGERAC